MKKISFFLIILSALAISTVANAAPINFELKSGWVAYHIDGKMFGFAAHPVDAVSKQINDTVNQADNKVTGTLTIPVKSLKSGDGALDGNAVTTLKGDKYPDITFELIDYNKTDAEMEQLLNASAPIIEKIKGKLTVAGVSKVYDFDIKVEKLKDGRFKLSTIREIKFTDFGITPPSMGAVSVLPDQIFIKGEIIFEKK